MSQIGAVRRKQSQNQGSYINSCSETESEPWMFRGVSMDKWSFRPFLIPTIQSSQHNQKIRVICSNGPSASSASYFVPFLSCTQVTLQSRISMFQLHKPRSSMSVSGPTPCYCSGFTADCQARRTVGYVCDCVFGPGVRHH